MHVLTKEPAGYEGWIMVTDAAGYQQLIDAALAYGDAWRARKAFGKQFGKNHALTRSFSKPRLCSSTKT